VKNYATECLYLSFKSLNTPVCPKKYSYIAEPYFLVTESVMTCDAVLLKVIATN